MAKTSRNRKLVRLERKRRLRRSGKILVLFALLLPAIMGIAALAIDAGLLLSEHRNAQHAADAAAMAAADDLFRDQSVSDAHQSADDFVHQHNALDAADVTFATPPSTGPYQGEDGFVEVEVDQPVDTFFIDVLGRIGVTNVHTRAVAGAKDATGGAAIVILDETPADLSIAPIPTLPVAAPALLGGLEIEGLGTLRVNGAVLVNNMWGGVDEDNNPAGEQSGLRNALRCSPALPLTALRATDIRVSGGVDDPDNYGHLSPGEESPLEANKRPVPDPFEDLPPPTFGTVGGVDGTLRGHTTVLSLPILPPVVLQPGIYESITVLAGNAQFQPGVYIIRNVNPLTQISLNLAGGTINAQGVMFYITTNGAYAPDSPGPDASDGENEPGYTLLGSVLPSVLIAPGLIGTNMTGLVDGGQFNGMLVYQRRADRRPIIIAQQNLIGFGNIQGTVYAKWGHVLLVSSGTYNMRFVAGTMRVATVLDTTIAPSNLLPPAQDIFLVE